jgi:peroxiredoxin Q/BCP
MNLQVGDQAPDFKLKNQDGKEVSLSDFRGSKVVVYFYPKDDTPGCTTQSCDLRDNHERLMAAGYTVLGVSADDEASHIKFRDKFNLPFDLLSDIDKKMIHDYGVWGTKQLYGREYEGILRTTFLINEHGIISDIITKVDTKEHTAQILKA